MFRFEEDKAISFINSELSLESSAKFIDELARNPSRAIVNEARQELNSASDVKYVHQKNTPAGEQFDPQIAHTDCSGFVSKVLFDQCPRQYNEIVESTHPWAAHPLAMDFTHFFSSLDQNPQMGFEQVKDPALLSEGAIIAWAKPNYSGRGNTGHVAIVDGTPGPEHQEMINGQNYNVIDVPVIDASSVSHFNETLPPNAHQSQRDGLGKGVVRVIVDSNETPIGYMEGTFSNEEKRAIIEPTMGAEISMARLV